MKKAIAARFPLSCVFEVTCKCSFRCPMCYVRMTDEQAAPFGQARTADEWIDMARQVRDAGTVYLSFTGGECTRLPGFERLYEAASKMGFVINFLSNGYDYSDELKDVISRYPPHGVLITLYGGSNETYEKMTGVKGGLDSACETIAFLQGLGVPVSLSFTATRDNIFDLPLVNDIARRFGLRYNVATDLVRHGYIDNLADIKRQRLTPAERVCLMHGSGGGVRAVLDKAKELEKELDGFELPKAGPLIPSQTFNCNGSYTRATILWNGNMHTCVSFTREAKYRPFEVGFAAAWKQLMDDHDEIFQASPVCGSCSMWDICREKCAARNADGGEGTLVPDAEVCKFTWLTKRYEEIYGTGSTLKEQGC